MKTVTLDDWFRFQLNIVKKPIEGVNLSHPLDFIKDKILYLEEFHGYRFIVDKTNNETIYVSSMEDFLEKYNIDYPVLVNFICSE